MQHTDDEAQALIRVVSQGTDGNGSGSLRLIFGAHTTDFVREQLVLQAIDLVVRTRTLRRRLPNGDWIYDVTLCDKVLTDKFFGELAEAIRARAGSRQFDYDFCSTVEEPEPQIPVTA